MKERTAKGVKGRARLFPESNLVHDETSQYGKGVAGRVTIKIPRQLYNHLRRFAADAGFSSVNELITFTMRTLVTDGGKTDHRKLLDKSLPALGKKLARLTGVKNGKARK